ncbi:MAG: DMT family transporter [Desulfobulbaceae bacterium]|nr:DMT family transporter [Desulfobulbaceae bacterium]
MKKFPAGGRAEGVLLVALSALAFSFLPIFIKYAYADGVGVGTMLALRFTLAALTLCGIMRLRKQPWPDRRRLPTLISLGALAYVGQSFCFFAALKYASAGLVSLLLYLYPALVLIFGALFFGEKIRPTQIAAVVAALFGTALIIGGGQEGRPVGIMLGIGAAVTYAVYLLVGSRVLRNEDALGSVTIICLAAAAVFDVAALWQGWAMPTTGAGWLAIFGIVFIATVLAMVAFFAGLARLSPADAATVATLEPVLTVALATVLFHEPLGWAKCVGGLVIIAAVLILARHGH